MIRRWICRLFGLVPVEETSSWHDLWQHKDARPVWPRVTRSDTWRNELEPRYKRMLLETFVAAAREQDANRKRILDARAVVLLDFLEEPRIAEMRAEFALTNAYRSGRRDVLDAEMERANSHAR